MKLAPKITGFLGNLRGTSLLEALLAGVILSLLAIGVTLYYSNASVSAVSTQRHLEASNLAASRMEDFRNHPYAYIPVTYDSQVLGGQMLYGSWLCNCNNVDFTQYPTAIQTDAYFSTFLDSVTIQGIVYTRYVCVVYISSDLSTQSCSSIPSSNLKTIRVHVTWNTNAGTQAVDAQSLAVGP